MKYKEPSNWVLPKHDTFFKKFKDRGELYSMTLPDWEIAEQYLNQKRGCLDIGGHVGTTALRYANNFEKVYTFEPLYHEALKKNLANIKVGFTVGPADFDKLRAVTGNLPRY